MSTNVETEDHFAQWNLEVVVDFTIFMSFTWLGKLGISELANYTIMCLGGMRCPGFLSFHSRCSFSMFLPSTLHAHALDSFRTFFVF